MRITESKGFNISLTPEELKEVGSIEKINKAFSFDNVLSFDIFNDDILVGFAQLREYDKSCYFLWHFGIDNRYQNKGVGTKVLIELIDYLKINYNLKEMTTTYLFGNEHAKHIYETVGFIETEIINEGDVHEVNMIYKLDEERV